MSACWDIIEGNIKQHIELMCPLRKIRIKHTGVPWINREIIELIQYKNKAWERGSTIKM